MLSTIVIKNCNIYNDNFDYILQAHTYTYQRREILRFMRGTNFKEASDQESRLEKSLYCTTRRDFDPLAVTHEKINKL